MAEAEARLELRRLGDRIASGEGGKHTVTFPLVDHSVRTLSLEAVRTFISDGQRRHLCSACGEHAAMPGHAWGLCQSCLRLASEGHAERGTIAAGGGIGTSGGIVTGPQLISYYRALRGTPSTEACKAMAMLASCYSRARQGHASRV